MKFVLKKTDKRHTGNTEWQYVVIIEKDAGSPFGYSAVQNKSKRLNEVREWCWTTYGPSCELEFWLRIEDGVSGKNEHWCWHTNFDNFKIYLRTDKEANWFKLKWL